MKTSNIVWTVPGSLGATCYVVANDANSDAKAWATLTQDAGYQVWVCDGVDDDVQIQAAIDAIATDGGVVYLTEGTYDISTTLLFRKHVSVRGAGGSWTSLFVPKGTVLKLANGSNCDVIRNYSYPAADWWIDGRDFVVDGNKANNTSGHGIHIGEATITPYVNFERITTIHCADRGFYFYTPNKTTLLNPNALYCGDNGIYCYGGEGYVIINPTFHFCGLDASTPAFDFQGRESSIFTVYMEDNYDGFYLRGYSTTILGIRSAVGNTNYAFKEEVTGSTNNIILGLYIASGESIITGGDCSIYGGYDQALTLAGTNTKFLGGTGGVYTGETKTISKAIDHADLTDNADATAYMDFADAIPAGSIVKAIACDFTEAFNSDDTTTLTMMIGYVGDLDAFNKTADPGEDAFNHTTDVFWGESDCQAHIVTAAKTPRVTFTEDDDGTDIISSANAAGAVTIYITYMKC